jgi:hypothetical protein
VPDEKEKDYTMSSILIDSDFNHSSRNTTPRDHPKAESMPYLEAAIPVGLIGAAVVAAFVLVLDTFAGNPLGTPNALGAALFRGETFTLSAPIRPELVLGYTLLHLAAFVSISCAAISAEYTLSRNGMSASTQIAVGILGILVSLQGIFAVLMTLIGIPFSGELGFERILVTNAIAAFSMGIAVHLRGRNRRERNSPTPID